MLDPIYICIVKHVYKNTTLTNT